MRKNVFLAWKESINEEVKKQLPGFLSYDKKEKGEEPGLMKFICEAREDLYLFVVFRPLDSEGFDAFVGWSQEKRCPYADSKVFDENINNISNFDAPYFMINTMYLVPRAGMAHWNFLDIPDHMYNDPEAFGKMYASSQLKTMTDEEAKVFVADAVNAGFKEVVNYGLPYLKKCISHKEKKY